MKHKILLTLILVATLIALFTISVCATEPVKTWDISETDNDSVLAHLYKDEENIGCYTLVIDGTGAMMDWTSSSPAPWYSSYGNMIKSVTVENGVTQIGQYAFYGCSYLEDITLPFVGGRADASVTSPSVLFGYIFGTKSYQNSYEAKQSYQVNQSPGFYHYGLYHIPASLKSVKITGGNKLFSSFSGCTSLTSISIPNSVTNIDRFTFEDCINLTDITIPESVTNIDAWAFSGCKNLESITIPNNISSIGAYAFKDCSKLENITVEGGNKTYKSIDGNIYSKNGKTLVLYAPGKNDISFSIPNGTTSIDSYAFYSCEKLLNIDIPKSVTSIGSYAFAYCNNLASVIIPEGVTTIGYSAFAYCDNLANVIISETVLTIGSYAFAFCDNLTGVIIPETVLTIDSHAFSNDDNLTIYCIAESKPRGWNTEWNLYSKNWATESYVPTVWGHIHNIINNNGTHTYDCICGLNVAEKHKFDNWTKYTETVILGECICGEKKFLTANELLESIFTFKGYSSNYKGDMAVGFDIDFEMLNLYEELTDEKLEIGVVFAGYDLLNGQNPLDNQGNTITLQNGLVAKGNLTIFSYTTYDFVLTDITEDIYDIPLVIAAYINNGKQNWYIQANGICSNVTGITYNEIIGG